MKSSSIKATIEVDPQGDDSYKVVLGTGCFHEQLNRIIRDRYGCLVILCDSRVREIYGEKIREGLEKKDSSKRPYYLISFGEGEENKNRKTKHTIEDEMMSLGCGRDTLILGLGGGVSTDVVGFVASTYMRGLDYFSIPTSLLAMVDATVGGKTGINTSFGKNLIGTFYHPKGVIIDVDFLNTLSDHHWKNGFAEMVKHGFVAQKDYFGFIEEHSDELFSREKNVLLEAIKRSIEIKADVVGGDPLETGRRKILNFGHTIGHAIERVSGWKINHGLAVAFGMKVEASIAKDFGFIEEKLVKRLESILESLKLTIELPSFDIEDLVSLLLLDKKNRKGKVRMALPVGLGEMYECEGDYSVEIDQKTIFNILKLFVK